MKNELTVVQEHVYYRIKEDFGILKKGMRCYCYAHDSDSIILFFETPPIGDIREIKLSKKKANILERL